MTTDPTLDRIGEAVARHHGQGDRDGAREMFARIWVDIGGERGDPLHVCVLAHSAADVQDDVRQELLWDERALTAAARLTDERVAEAGVPMTVAALYPSLHLSLADCHRRLGDLDLAREHLQQARERMSPLGDTDYGRLIRDGLDRMTQQLSSP
ncbi:tetratricopeptide repeat protein [Actinoplanes sp. NPDC000266]